MKKMIVLGTLTLLLTAGLAGCTAGKDSSAPANAAVPGSSDSVPWIATKNTTRINTSDPIQAAVLV